MGEPKLLVVEDDEALRDELIRTLTAEGYGCLAAGDSEEAEEFVRQKQPDLVLLDVMLPGRDGYDLCRRIRSFSDIPVIFLTSRDTQTDELYGMTLGADDFIRKPCNLPVLLVRIKNLLKRVSGTAARSESSVIECGGLSVHLTKSFAEMDGRKEELTRNELHILEFLMRHEGEIIPRVDLIEELWDNQVYIDDNTLSVHMTRLRAKLKIIGAGECVRTRYGQGYLFSMGPPDAAAQKE